MVMKKWLDQRAITSPLLSELNRNAKEAGWQRPQVSADFFQLHSQGCKCLSLQVSAMERRRWHSARVSGGRHVGIVSMATS